MQISIFPEAKAHPKGKDEKVLNAKYVSKPHLPKTVDINDEADLVKYVTQYAWSPCVFSGHRNNDSFVSTDFMVIDVDNGLTIAEMEKRCEMMHLCHLILPSPSFTEEAQRFRVIFPLVESIYEKEVFDLTWAHLQELFPELDKQCSDYARFYYGSYEQHGVWGEGDFLAPIKPEREPLKLSYDKAYTYVPVEGYDDLAPLEKLYGKVPDMVPKRVDFFLKGASSGLPGEWIVSLNHFCFVTSLQGVEEEVIWDLIESLAPEPLDKRDNDTIKRAIKDGQRAKGEKDALSNQRSGKSTTI